MLVLSLPSSLLMVSHCNLLPPIEKMVPILMLLPGAQNRQCAFFDVRVFNPFVHSYFHSQLSSCHQLHECEKRQAYDECVREVERTCFSPLVSAAASGMGLTATTVFRKLAPMLAEKCSINYSKCLFWL